MLGKPTNIAKKTIKKSISEKIDGCKTDKGPNCTHFCATAKP